MNTKLISILMLIVSIGTALVGPLAGIKPAYGIIIGLVAAVAGATSKGLMEFTGNRFLTYLGIIVAGTAAVVNYADVQTILSPEVLSFLTNLGAIAAAIGKGIMEREPVPEG